MDQLIYEEWGDELPEVEEGRVRTEAQQPESGSGGKDKTFGDQAKMGESKWYMHQRLREG